MAMQDDGNLVIYDNRDGALLWARFGFEPGRFKKLKLINTNGPHNTKDIHTWHF